MSLDRNNIIDLFRIIAAIAVIGIHTRVLKSVSSEADFFFCDILCRWAVPYFAVCSGFFLAKKLKVSNDRVVIDDSVKKEFCRRASHSLLLYCLWSILFFFVLLAGWIHNGQDLLEECTNWFRLFLTGKSYYHLWYLLQLSCSYCYFFLILKFAKIRCFPFFIALFWLFGITVYVYYEVIPFDAVKTISRTCRSVGAVVCSIGQILPLMMTGFCLAKMNFNKIMYLCVGVVISFIYLCSEVYWLHNLGATRFSYVLFTLPFAFFLFGMLNQIGNNCLVSLKQRVSFAKLSAIVYFLHPLIIRICSFVNIHHSVILFALVTTVTFCISLLYLLLRQNFDNRKSLIR